MSASNPDSDYASQARFAETRWTMVLSARDQDTPESGTALEVLCRTYWQPLYAFARRQGYSSHDAQDHTQEFFARLLAKDFLRSVAPEKGRFRTFLLVAFKRHLANAREHACAQRRGGGREVLSLDVEAAENLFQSDPLDAFPADDVYERQWALTLLERTIARLHAEHAASGRVRQFETLKGFLVSADDPSAYETASAALGLSPGTVRVAVHRLRRRYREIFRDEVAQTVSDLKEVDDEVAHLLRSACLRP